MKKGSSNKGKNIFLTIIGAVFVCLFFQWYLARREIRKNMEISSGLVVAIRPASRGNIILVYTYKVGEQVFEGTEKYAFSDKAADSFYNKRFPLVYSRVDPENHDMLIIPSEFSTYGMLFPDSLNWIKGYYTAE